MKNIQKKRKGMLSRLNLRKCFFFMQCCNDMHGQQVNVSHFVHDAVQHNLCLQPQPYQIQAISCESFQRQYYQSECELERCYALLYIGKSKTTN